MKQSDIIRLVDLVSFIALIFMISTGVLLEFTLPERSGRASVLGMTRHEWGDVHLWIAVAFLLLMIAHLVLHIKYIRSALLGKAGADKVYRIIIGFVSLILLIALVSGPLFMTPEVPDNPGGIRYHQFR